MELKSILYDVGNFLKVSRSLFRSGYTYSNIIIEKELLILANGPSAKEYLAELCSNEEEHIMCLNDFACSDYFCHIKPNYYILLDPAYWKKPEEINSGDIEMRDSVYKNLLNKVTWDMTLFIPFQAKGSFLFNLSNNKHITLAPFRGDYLSMVDSPFFYLCLERNWGTPFNNVLAAATYISINIGYKKIGLLGSDHSWTIDLRVNENNEVCLIKRHSYDQNEELIPWKTSLGESYTISHILEDLERTFRSYEFLRKYSEKHHVKIINYSSNSFIDAFNKETLKHNS